MKGGELNMIFTMHAILLLVAIVYFIGFAFGVRSGYTNGYRRGNDDGYHEGRHCGDQLHIFYVSAKRCLCKKVSVGTLMVKLKK